MRSHILRKKLALAFLLAFAGIAGVTFAVWPREHGYQGKPFSYWLDRLPARLTWTNVPYSTLTKASYQQFLVNRVAADAAVDLLGPGNLPMLVKRLGTRETGLTRFKHDLNAVAIRFGIRKPAWQIDTAWFRRGQAIYAISRLGQRATSITPQLLVLAKDADPGVQRDALEVLRQLSLADYANVTGQTNWLSAETH